MDRLLERLEVAQKALISLQELVYISEPTDIERDAAIQRFETTFEATWKTAQRYLLVVEGLTVGSPKSSIRAARDVALLDDEQAVVALEMADDRNLTVHTYNNDLANTIFAKLLNYTDLCDHWLRAMQDQCINP